MLLLSKGGNTHLAGSRRFALDRQLGAGVHLEQFLRLQRRLHRRGQDNSGRRDVSKPYSGCDEEKWQMSFALKMCSAWFYTAPDFLLIEDA